MKKIKISLLFLVVQLTAFSQTTYYDDNTKKYGIFDNTQKIILNPTYEYLSQVSNGFAVFKENGKYGLLDKTGKIILKPIFNNPCNLQYAKICDGLIRVVNFEYLDEDSSSYNEKYGFYNLSGILKIKFNYSWAGDFCNGKAIVIKDDKYNIININGEVLYPNWVDDENEIKEKLLCNTIQNDEYDHLYRYNYDRTKYFQRNENETDNKGYVNEKGEIIIKTNINYGNLCSYNKKLDRALVFENEKIPYLINKKGEIISNLSEKIADLNASENMYFKFINGIGELVVVKKSWDGEEEKFDYQYYLIDINGNIIKKMLKGTSDLIMDCNYGNR